jgi:hypothetical protein
MFLTALAVRRRVPLWLAGLALGLAAGFRPQGVLGLALALLLAAVWLRARAHTCAATGLAVALGTLAWLLPLLAAFGWSIGALRTYLGGATTFVRTQESLFATVVSGESVAARWRELWFWSSQAVFAPAAGWLRVGLFWGMLALIGIAGLKLRCSRGLWLCLAWCLPQALLHVLFLNPSLTRYLLTFLFPVAMLVAAGLDSILPRRLAAGVVLAFMAVVGSSALPLARGLHTIPAPPEQLVAYVAERFSSSQTLIIARQSYNALAYHLPGWQTRFADYYGDAALERQIAEGQQTYVVIADPETLQPSEEYVEIETRRFARDAQIHAKHAQVEVNVSGRAAHLALRDFALPEAKMIQLGTPQDGKYVLDGWYRREEIGGVAARWTGSEITATLRVFLPQEDVTLTLRVWSFAPEQTLEAFCGDQFVGSVSVPQNWADVSVRLPASGIPADALTYIHLCPAVLVMPASDGRSTDRRTLGIAVAELKFTR